jgi:hypothetical protein
VSSEGFANRATATLDDPSVRDLLAERVTDRLVLRNRSELLTARPLIISAVSGIVGGGAFGGLFHRAALDVHRAVFDRDQNTITLTLVDVGTVASEALHELRPQLAEEIDASEASERITVVREDIGSVSGDLARLAERVRALFWIFGGLTIVAAAAAVWAAPDKRRAVSRLGIAAVAAGVLVVLTYVIGYAVVLAGFDDPEERAAAGAVWREFLGDLRSLGLVLAAAGAIAAASAASLIHPDELERPALRAWRIATTEPQRPWLRALRALALIVIGVIVVVEPTVALQVVAVGGGLILVHEGAQTLLRLIYRPPKHAPEPEVEPGEPGRARRVAVGVAAVAAVAGLVTLFVAAGGVEEPQAAARGCNGSERLCSQRLDEVVLPATHNSMSVPLPGWFSAEQERPIAEQLDDGIRGLLLDTHYGERLGNGRVRTEVDSPQDLRDKVKDDGMSDRSIEAALRLRERAGFRGRGERGMYLCHSFCELGATRLEPVLEDLHEFLVTNPNEIVVLVNQDYVTPEDFVRAVRDADLERLVLKGLDENPLPTLQEMIDRDERLVLLAENHAGAAPWYQLAYDRLVEETPFLFRRVADLTSRSARAASCGPNRGPEEAPVFLVNHWISTDPVPKPADASRVNAYRPLLARARECERIRGHVPNLLAVNFYLRGDLFRVVDTLNDG